LPSFVSIAAQAFDRFPTGVLDVLPINLPSSLAELLRDNNPKSGS